MSSGPEIQQSNHADLVARLEAIWSRMLGMSAIAPDDNFFDLGGDSLIAVNLFLEIERETGIKLPITLIYDAPTIEALANVIAGETAAPKFSPLVLLKAGDNSAPLFIVHGIGGTVMEFAALGRAIRIPSPVYAVQAQGLDGVQPPLESIDEMAALYLDHLRALQPEGPYRLSGYSFGGLVALEMARRLRRENLETAPPVLIDAYAHPSTWPRISRLKMRARRTLHLAGRLAHKPLRQSLPSVFAKLRPFAPRKDAGTRLRDWLLDQNPDLPAPLLRVREAGSVALAHYMPNYYPGKIVFLKASRPDPEFPDDPERIWSSLVRKLDIHIVPGRHRTMVGDHATELADHLSSVVLAASSRRDRKRGAGAGSRDSTKSKTSLQPQAV